jgi:hypothetical protein
VDEDIYQHRPDLIIATVDKYAQMAWEGKVADLFNRPSRSGNKDISPPDLIIQDELHLISGPLGTMTGLYESAVDYCCSEGGIEPKIIASTATIRGARKQVLGLFDREVRQFPSPGLDSRDSFFAVEADPQEKGTREYVGVASPGMAHARLLTRVYASLLQSVCEEASSCVVKDPYWTLIGYFNSLKVLGSSLAQVEEEVPLSVSILSRRHGSSSVRFRKGGLLYQELDSNIKSSKIPEIIKGLGVMYNGDPNGPAFDIILATNMISVGMDVSRLGLMAVMGTPPSTSEYIQSTSRVGRSSPGLVVMMYNDAKTRDKSYYESFMQYHSALYTHVESTSLTPFSIKARERGLHAVIVAMVRISIPEMREDEDAGKIGEHKQEVLRIVGWLLDRISRTSKSNLEGAEEDALDFVSDWEARAEECRLRGSILCYRTKSPPNARTKKEPLLRVNDGPNGKGPAAIDSTEDGIPTMMSLRDVDRSSNLFLWEGD